MKLTEDTKKRIDDYFSKLTHKELLHINEKYFNKPLEAINYTRCCDKLKDKETITFEEWKKDNVIEKNVCNEYLYRYGGWFDADDLLSMYKKDISL